MGEADPGFDFYPMVFDTYSPETALASLPGAEAYADSIAAALAPYGGRKQTWLVPNVQRTHDAATARLTEWSRPTSPRSSILLWIGHGAVDTDGEAWLHTRDSNSPAAGLPPHILKDAIVEEWATRSDEDRAEWTMIVIEACGAAGFARRLMSVLTERADCPKRLAIIGIGPDDGATNLGAFLHALKPTLGSYTDNDNEVRISDFFQQLYRRVPKKAYFDLDLEDAAPLRRARLLPDTIATIDAYGAWREFIERLPAHERYHFLAKAQGAEIGEQSWFFVGRKRERRGLSRHLSTMEHGMVIVSGRAGSGKSALLGNVLIHTKRELLSLLQASQLLPETSPDELPPENAFHAVIHLSGLTIDGVVARIADALGVTISPDHLAPVDLLTQAVHDHDGTFRLLADALDEAQDPIAVAGTVLRRLAALRNPLCHSWLRRPVLG